MTTSYTTSKTFSYTDAKYLASKVVTDLRRMSRYYGAPSAEKILQFEAELAEYLRYGYLERVYYGFKQDNKWVEPTLKYEAAELQNGVNDDPGRVRADADVSKASFYSLITTSKKYDDLSKSDQEKFDATLPIQRGIGSSIGTDGVFEADNKYSSGGTTLSRSSLRSY